MPLLPYSTAHIDYIQRTNIEPIALTSEAAVTNAPLQFRRIFRITEIGLLEKQWNPQKQGTDGRRFRLPTEDVITGLYGYKVPLAFLVDAKSDGVAINLGVWSPSDQVADAAMLDSREHILKASLTSLFSSVNYQEPGPLEPYRLGGLVLGTPTAKPPDMRDGALQIDRLIRALSGTNWSCLVLAQPLDDLAISGMRDSVFNEIRVVQSAAKTEGAPSPLANHYVTLLKALSKTLNSAQASGGWRTAVYLLGENDSYYRLASLWRGIYSGDDSLPEPIRVFDSADVIKLAADWAMLDTSVARGPGNYQIPLDHQTILSSRQLAAYVHLPQLETSGFSISEVPNFDVVPRSPKEGSATADIGKIVVRGNTTVTDYEVELNALNKHVFIPGVTGAGKTTTIFGLLRQAWAAKIPFLVIEPAKTEYRDLRKYSDFGDSLRVFTLGDENTSPLRINPFDLVHPDTPLSLHIDLLRSVFTHSFGLWNPLPQILEECLYLLYEDKGWDVTLGVNRRTKDLMDPNAFPTLSELVDKIHEVTERLQWDPEAKGRIQGALRDKIKGLSHGGRGRMLDVRRSVPMKELMENPTVLELERLGDEDDKAFLMGLLFIRLSEYRRANGESKKLQHLLVFEEAHRLLTNVASTQGQGEGNARAKAVESFTNLLSEIRSYGEGVIIADQVPVKLAPDVIKNTNLKIAHRIVDAEDRKVLAGSMAMTEKQTIALQTFGIGRTAVFMEGDDSPLLVQIPNPDDSRPDDYDTQTPSLEQQMARWRVSYQDLYVRHHGCKDTSENGGAACEAARSLVETPTFGRDLNRLILSVLADATAASRLWPIIDQSVNLFIPPNVNREIMLQCLVARAAQAYSSRRGFQSQWTFADTNRLAAFLEGFLSDLARGQRTEGSLDKLKECFLGLHTMPAPYYSRCLKICDSQPARCLYRHAVAEIVESESLTPRWNGSDPFNPAKAEATWKVCWGAGNRLVEKQSIQAAQFRRICLCYGQMMLASSGTAVLPEARDQLVDLLCDQAAHKPSQS